MNLARITIISVVIFGVCLCDIGVKAQTEPMSLKIEIDHSSVQIGADIPVTVLLTNNTDHAIPGSKVIMYGDSGFEYKVNVEREDHAAVARKYAEKHRRNEIG